MGNQVTRVKHPFDQTTTNHKIHWISHQTFNSYRYLIHTKSKLINHSTKLHTSPSINQISFSCTNTERRHIMGTEVGVSEPLIAPSEKISAVDEDDQTVPEWKDQITIRGLVVSAMMGTLFCIITHKLNLTVGIIPSLNVAAGLLGFFFVKSWTSFLSKLGFSIKPFTRQENTVIQTCVVACYGLAFSGNYSVF